MSELVNILISIRVKHGMHMPFEAQPYLRMYLTSLWSQAYRLGLSDWKLPTERRKEREAKRIEEGEREDG